MTVINEDLPHWTEVETPWPPQQIVWQRDFSFSRHEALEWAVNIPGATHIVREARVRLGPKWGDQVEDLEMAAGWADREFSLLRSCGLEVADTQWHIWADPHHKPRLLAKVAIIDGLSLGTVSRGSHEGIRATLNRKIEKYHRSQLPGDRLSDIDSRHQYIHGRPREATLATESAVGHDTTYLVDIEPFFHLRNYLQS